MNIYISYIYIYIYTLYIYIYVYIRNHETNVPCQLSPQWLCGNSFTWAHDEYDVFLKDIFPKCLMQH